MSYLNKIKKLKKNVIYIFSLNRSEFVLLKDVNFNDCNIFNKTDYWEKIHFTLILINLFKWMILKKKKSGKYKKKKISPFFNDSLSNCFLLYFFYLIIFDKA